LAFLLTLYAVDFVSYRWLGANINYKMAQIFVEDLLALKQMVPLPGKAYLGLAVFVFALLAAFVALAPKTLRGIEALLLPQGEISLFKNRSRTRKSLVTITALLMAFAFYLYLLRQRAAYSETLSNDPVVSFARNTTGLFDQDYPAYAARLKQEEERCRDSYPRPNGFDAKNVVIIVGDSLRSDHMSVYGYQRPTTPFLEGLLASGRLRRVGFATSTCSETLCGLLSTLDSKLLKRQIPDAFKLQELLQSVGYDSFFILSGNHKGRLRDSYGYGMNFYSDGTTWSTYDVNDDRLIFEGLNHVPTRQSRPAFFMFHLMSAHLAGTQQEQFRVYNPSHVDTDWVPFSQAQMDPQSVLNNYDNRVLQADAIIKQIFEVLDQKGYLKNSIVIILGDHGESLGERQPGEYGHIFHLYQEYISIPLLIYDPEPVDYRNLTFATQIDIAPTILDRLKLPIPECWDGQSLMAQRPRTLSVHQTRLRNQCSAIIERSEHVMYKYLYCAPGKTEELYDLNQDPREQKNLMNSVDRGTLQRLRGELQRALQN
jgi:glucan phosphoethanolaminetransferase (alkaline phosphatase superfamily)